VFDHVTIRAKSIDRAKRFYCEALAPLGYKVLYESKDSIGLGDGKESHLWLVEDSPSTSTMHLAFSSPDRKKVDAFHAAALAAGGRDNGKPGPRPDYGANYYAAFVHDPDGNNIEAVCYA
jgi:catechol 2,3-dioxygenase-like lactoylglutathione lyase family enzyme